MACAACLPCAVVRSAPSLPVQGLPSFFAMWPEMKIRLPARTNGTKAATGGGGLGGGGVRGFSFLLTGNETPPRRQYLAGGKPHAQKTEPLSVRRNLRYNI